MKRISFFLVALSLTVAPGLRGQDAATEERLNKLSGQIENLVEGQQSLKRQIEALAREVESLRAEAGKPKGDYASQSELNRLAEAVKVVDRKRMEDNETIKKELNDLGRSLKPAAPPPPPKKPSASSTATEPSDADKSTKPETGYGYYTVKKGDTLDAIVQAYADKHIKLTSEQIVKANPGLVPEKMRIGQKIWIPTPQ
jgi:LysM repeat protein